MYLVRVFFPTFLSGHHSYEGAEHKTTGGVHVQCVEEAGLRRGLPLALPVHRLKQPIPDTTPPPPSRGGGAKPNHSRRPPLPPVPSYSAPCLVIQVCLHFQRNQYNLIPIDFYWWNIWFNTYRIHTCMRERTRTLVSISVFFLPPFLPSVECDDRCIITVNLYMIPLVYQESLTPLSPLQLILSNEREQHSCIHCSTLFLTVKTFILQCI